MRILHLVPILGLAGLAVLAFHMLFRSGSSEVALQGQLARAALPQLELASGAPIEGQLVDLDGLPLRDALLVCQVQGRPFWTHTSATGSFAFSDVPIGEHELLILARGFPSATRVVTAGETGARLQLSEGRPEAPHIDGPRPSDLLGRLTYHESIERFEGAHLLLLPLGVAWEASTPMPRWSTIDERGAFRFDQLSPGRYRAMLLPEWAGESRWPDLLAPLDGSRTLTYEHPPPADEEVSFAVIAGTIQGSVFRLDRGAGSSGSSEKVEGATIYAIPDPAPVAGLIFGPTASDASGQFALEHLPPGTYEVHARLGAAEHVARVRVFPNSTIVPDFDTFD